MAGENGTAVARGGLRTGPLAPLVSLVRRCLVHGDAGAAAALAGAGLPVAARIGDRDAALRLLALHAWALLALDRPQEAVALASALLTDLPERAHPDPHADGVFGAAPDAFESDAAGPEADTDVAGERLAADTRPLVLALLACAHDESGDAASALDALAEALATVETTAVAVPVPAGSPPPPSAPVRHASWPDEADVAGYVEACCAVAEALERMLLVEAAAELLDRLLAAAPAGTDPAVIAPALRRRVTVELTWAAHLDLLDGAGAAARAPVLTALGLRLAATGRTIGDGVLVSCGIAAEVYALERTGTHALARARAEGALAQPPGAVPAEWLPGRVALARALAAGGETERARVLLAAVRAACSRAHLRVWAELADLALAELAEGARTTARDELAEPPLAVTGRVVPSSLGSAAAAAPRGWRDVARAVQQRVWQEREGRLADLRQRILREELARRSSRRASELLLDPLTGLGNRRRLENEAGSGTSATVVFADLDSFKLINDSCGHGVGDEVLRRVAGLLRASCRAEDVVVRYGGDEFVVLVRGASTARAIGERLLERVRGYDWAPLTGGRPVTLSVGVSEGRDLAGALRASDAAMLRAKRAGRDGLVHAVPRAPAPRTEHARYPPVAPGAWSLTVVPDPLPATVATTLAGPPAVVAEFGPFDLLADWAHELYVAGRAREAQRACAAGLLVTEPAGDRETSRFLRYVGCLVHAQQGHWSWLRRATEDHLDTLDPDAGPYWRAKFLALHAMALVYLGRPAAAIDSLAEAHELLDVPGRAYNRASALMVLAGSVRGALMFRPALRLLDETAAATDHDYLRALARVERGVVQGLWALFLELVGRAGEAHHRFADCATSALAAERTCREQGLPPGLLLQAQALLHFAYQRLGVPGVDTGLLERQAAGAPPREGLLARLALASVLARTGDVGTAAARTREVRDLAALEHEPVVAWVAAGWLAELDELSHGPSEASRRWRQVASGPWCACTVTARGASTPSWRAAASASCPRTSPLSRPAPGRTH